jgi:DNA-binding MarR family transcriptional regulator
VSDAELNRLAFEIRAYAGIGAKLMARDLEARIAQHWPGVSAPQYGVMRMLACRPATIKELSDTLRLAPSTLVPVIDRLESEGLVVRRKDPGDRRRTPLDLTEAARAMLARVPPAHESDSLYRALRDLGPARSRQLCDLLLELVERLEPGADIAGHVRASAPGNARTTETSQECN